MLLNLFARYGFYVKLRAMFAAFGLIHAIYLALFIHIDQLLLACLNVISVALYAACVYMAKDLKTAAIAVAAVRIEIFAHAFICTLVLGWDYGFQNIILALMSMVFFSSLATKGVNNFFAYAKGAAYLFLYFYAKTPPQLAGTQAEFFYVLNFIIIATIVIVLVIDFSRTFSAKLRQDMLERQERLSELANKDPLTGLLNRNAFYDFAVPRMQFLSGDTSIVLCDIDDFKKLNDAHGHAFGDEALKTLAHAIKSSLRECDLVYRWGGEEFLIFLSDINLENSEHIFERIRRKIAETQLEFEGKSAKTSATFGLVNFSVKAVKDVDTVIKQADKLLYEGKNSGKNKVVARAFYGNNL
jgi:hypothetical protein